MHSNTTDSLTTTARERLSPGTLLTFSFGIRAELEHGRHRVADIERKPQIGLAKEAAPSSHVVPTTSARSMLGDCSEDLDGLSSSNQSELGRIQIQ